MMSSAMWCVCQGVCAAHWLSIARELDPTRCWLETPWFLLLRLAFQQLSQHISNIVPHPAYNRQSSSLSVKRAVGAGNGATRGAWKAPGQAAYLARLQSARRALPRDRRSRPSGAVANVSAKRLTENRILRARTVSWLDLERSNSLHIGGWLLLLVESKFVEARSSDVWPQ